VAAPKIMIMGIGNILLSDEGLGIHFLQQLATTPLPETVELLEGGTAGLELIHLISEIDYLIIIDALNAHTEPGTIFKFRPDDIRIIPDQYEVSFHQVGILEVLAMADLLNQAPKTIIFGVQPKSLDWGLSLSPEVQVSFPRLQEYVLAELESIHNLKRFSIAN